MVILWPTVNTDRLCSVRSRDRVNPSCAFTKIWWQASPNGVGPVKKPRMGINGDASYRAANSTRIRESILATILVTFWYENQFPSLNCVLNVLVSIKFDSRKQQQICTPVIIYPHQVTGRVGDMGCNISCLQSKVNLRITCIDSDVEGEAE